MVIFSRVILTVVIFSGGIFTDYPGDDDDDNELSVCVCLFSDHLKILASILSMIMTLKLCSSLLMNCNCLSQIKRQTSSRFVADRNTQY